MSGQLYAVNLTTQASTPEAAPGTRHSTSGGTHYVYVKANGAKTANLVYALDDTFTVQAAIGGTTTFPASGKALSCCCPQLAITDAYYAWAPVKGPFTITSDGAIASAAKIYTSPTDGKLDDSSSSQLLINGLMVYTAIASSTTGTAIATQDLWVSN